MANEEECSCGVYNPSPRILSSFTPDERVKKPRVALEDEPPTAAQITPSLLGWGLRYAATPTPVTLPPQLFPWKDIRLRRILERRGESQAAPVLIDGE